MTEQLKGIIIKAIDYKDSDKILTILTENKGKISALAKGVKKKNSPLASAVMPFTYCTFQLYKGTKYYTVDDADVEMTFNLSSDIEKIALASYVCELANFENQMEIDDERFLRLVLNCLYAIDKNLVDFKQIKSAFELKCVKIWGYSPSLCAERELNSKEIYINHEDGGLCSQNIFKHSSKIGIGTLQAIQYILTADLKKMLNFRLEAQSLSELADFSQSYILDKIEYKPKTLAFYESLF